MEIRKCTMSDLFRVMTIYESARAFMRDTGNASQWGGTYPGKELISDDIANGRLYTVARGDELLAVFYFNVGEDPTYKEIYEGGWKSDAPYGVIHRIAVAENAHGMGLSRLCFDYCYEQCGNLRIDTHRDNIPMQRALAKSGFEYCGIIYLSGTEERLAYQKI